jgi:hypothetical protein
MVVLEKQTILLLKELTEVHLQDFLKLLMVVVEEEETILRMEDLVVLVVVREAVELLDLHLHHQMFRDFQEEIILHHYHLHLVEVVVLVVQHIIMERLEMFLVDLVDRERQLSVETLVFHHLMEHLDQVQVDGLLEVVPVVVELQQHLNLV